ncbi:hypothetical protein B0T16DRAFT_32583 [Cercophora newfieldiana]|uniref:Uncharacterized protein n=1 Tax=Cercophora newfieldiana TaxID=92897 RepID=A0AA39YR95_9PEZI|nr:hypothetical protein B0T16DRAFT_32583 [Cercophora newfieldiana]
MWSITAALSWLTGRDELIEPIEPAVRTPEEILSNPYLPSVLDVIVVKSMLVKGLKLPLELIDSIVDQAEYWPHTSSEINYATGDSPFYTVGYSTTADDSENELLLRAVPLGFLKWPPQDPPLEKARNLHPTAVQPSPPGEQFPADVFQGLMGYPVPLVTHPCRKIVFTTRSRDQAWGGDAQDHHTYHGSWTWFEAGLERWTRKQGDSPPETQMQPSLALKDLTAIYPPVVAENENTYKYDHQLLPSENLKVQCNKTAVHETLEHTVVWRYTDDMDPENEQAAAELASSGRGTATGDGRFVRQLELGDIVTLWGKTRFPGWANHVESVKVEVYWVV